MTHTPGKKRPSKTAKRSWQKLEQRVCARFGGRRTPLSGSNSLKKINTSPPDPFDVAGKTNEIIDAINGLKCQKEDAELPIFELLRPYDALIVSQNSEGILVAANDGWGKIVFERVKYPEEEQDG